MRLLPHRGARGLPPLGGLGVRAADGGRDSGLLPGGGGLARPAAVPADLLRQRADVSGADRHPAPLGKYQVALSNRYEKIFTYDFLTMGKGGLASEETISCVT